MTDIDIPPNCPRGCGMFVRGDDHAAHCSNSNLDPKILTDTVLGGDLNPMKLAAVLDTCASMDLYPPRHLERFFGIVKNATEEERVMFGAWISFMRHQAPIDAHEDRHVSMEGIALALLRGNLKSSFEKWINKTPFTFQLAQEYNATFGTSMYIKHLKKKKAKSECWIVPRIVAADAASAAGGQVAQPGVRCTHCGTDQEMCLKFRGGLKRCSGPGCSRNRSSALMYCGVDCQRIDWTNHKRICMASTADA